MSVIIEVTVPGDDFELGRALRAANDGARFELERMVPTTDRIIPYFWVQNADFAALEASLPEADNIIDVALLDAFDDRALFRIEWPPDINGLVRNIDAYDATILNAVGTAERWEFQLRFEDSAAVSEFATACKEAGVHLTLRRLYRPDESDVEAAGLTSIQRETLLTALEQGYFSIPRRVTAEEIADQLGISDQAVSERLRRAQTNVFTSLLLVDG